jgi:hypothetical protein
MPRAIFALIFAVFWAGCGAFQPRPPAFSLYDRQRLVVLPFENLTQDSALAKTIQDDVIGGLVRLQACPIAAQDDVAAQIEKMGPGAGTLEDNSARKKIAERFKSDTIMVGTVNSYSESVGEEQPRRLKQRDGTYRWGYADISKVNIGATVKLIDAGTGNILWVRKATGEGTTQRWTDLPWSGEKEAAPPEGWDRLRAQAVKGNAGGAPDGGEKAGQDNAGGTPATAPGGQTINIIIQQQATQTQQQEQTQTQAQAQTQTAPAAEAKPVLLYQSDNNVFRARQNAISRIAQVIMSDYRGTFGWKPGESGPQ